MPEGGKTSIQRERETMEMDTRRMDRPPETVGQILARLSPGLNTPNQKTSVSEEETEEQIQQRHEQERQSARDQLRASLRVSSLNHTFETFEVNARNRTAHIAFLAMAQCDSRPLLLCYGGVGNGKTHLCEALILKLYKDFGYRTTLTRWADLLRYIKAGMGQKEIGIPDASERLTAVCKRPRLIIDDVGMGGGDTAWGYTQLEELVVYRYHERLMTVLTTNLDVMDLSERIYSRFSDPEVGFIVCNEDEDHRRR
jgi:DNA replication protein DnaC